MCFPLLILKIDSRKGVQKRILLFYFVRKNQLFELIYLRCDGCFIGVLVAHWCTYSWLYYGGALLMGVLVQQEYTGIG